jgi:hypothetical protein
MPGTRLISRSASDLAVNTDSPDAWQLPIHFFGVPLGPTLKIAHHWGIRGDESKYFRRCIFGLGRWAVWREEGWPSHRSHSPAFTFRFPASVTEAVILE